MRAPENVDTFLHQLNHFRKAKGKAANILFNDIENDINDKQSFLLKQ